MPRIIYLLVDLPKYPDQDQHVYRAYENRADAELKASQCERIANEVPRPEWTLSVSIEEYEAASDEQRDKWESLIEGHNKAVAVWYAQFDLGDQAEYVMPEFISGFGVKEIELH